MRDACTRGGFCHRCSATELLSKHQARRCFKVREEDEEVLARLEMGQSSAGILVSVLRTHARMRGWSAGPSAGGDMLDNGEALLEGF